MSSPTPSARKPGEHVDHAYRSSESITCTCTCSCGESAGGGGKGGPLDAPMAASLADDVVHLPPSDTAPKIDDDRIEVSPLPPALPPRPPPRPRYDSLGSRCRERATGPGSGRIRKYVFWCCACGGLATILGALFLAVYFLLRSYTSTLGYFETIPTFVPAAMLILTGLCVMSLSRRKNRYSYLLKVCGVCCLVCALTCVLVTITTTVIHMNRLQTLRECVYTQKTRTCTCYSVLLEAQPHADDGMRFVFDATPDCEVIHGALYTCLRAMFGLSVSGILVCIFSCMLVYQLLSHERKKMYWEQLELRCRSFYQHQQQQPPPPPPNGPPASAASSLRGLPMPPAAYCSCCDECQYPQVIAAPQMYPWDAAERFWTPRRVGNFYSPTPGEEAAVANEGRGWNWRRLPWSRPAAPDSSSRDGSSLTYQGIASSAADSQYGFTHEPAPPPPPPPATISTTGSYSTLDARAPAGGVYVWGPPPPYSNPNSPARRAHVVGQLPARYHHVHHAHHHHHHHHHQAARARPKDNYENAGDVVEYHHAHNDPSDTSSGHAAPVRKAKKRTDASGMKATAAAAAAADDEHETSKAEEGCRYLPRLQGVENAAFQQQEASPPKAGEPSESEVYFADVSSCCNISVRNDGPDSSLYDEAVADKATTGLPADASCSSLASSAQTPLTETTDDCGTPGGAFLAPDAQYEVIPEPTPAYRPAPGAASNLAATISGLTQPYARCHIGANISSIIKNPIGLLYNEAGSGSEEVQCHDVAGWQSAASKQEPPVNMNMLNLDC